MTETKTREQQSAESQAACDDNMAEQQAEAADNMAEPSIEEQLAAWHDKYLRLQAEFDNFRKRTLREKWSWWSMAARMSSNQCCRSWTT